MARVWQSPLVALAAACLFVGCADSSDSAPKDATSGAKDAAAADAAADTVSDSAAAPDISQPDAPEGDTNQADAAQGDAVQGDAVQDGGAAADGGQDALADSKGDATVDADGAAGADVPGAVDTSPDTAADSSACAKAVLASAVVQGRQLQLAASPTTAGGKAVISYAWSVQVPKAGGKLSPDASSPQVTFGPLIYRGDYEVCLQVNAAGEKSCAATCKTLSFEPDLYLELTWLSPGAPEPTGNGSADLNLHLVHGGAASGKDLDCDGAPDPWYDDKVAAYWFNDAPDWGKSGSSADDPWVDDAANATKPEVISVLLPDDGTYTVAAHALSDKGVGASLASLSVYYKGQLLNQQAGISLAQSDLWTAGAITIQSGAASFSTCLQSGDACKSGKLWQPSGEVCMTPCFEYKGLFSVPTLSCAWKWQ